MLLYSICVYSFQCKLNRILKGRLKSLARFHTSCCSYRESALSLVDELAGPFVHSIYVSETDLRRRRLQMTPDFLSVTWDIGQNILIVRVICTAY